MAFCTNCGTPNEGAFCKNCGARMGSEPAAAPPVAPAEAAPAGKKKVSPIIWILAGLVGFFLLIGILFVGAGFFVANKVKNAGFDTELMEKNPVLGAAKIAATLNPDVEVVNVDEAKGTLSIRDKKTGKVITMNAEDVKEGKIIFSDESTGESVSFGAERTAKLPDWVPAYPGSAPQGAFSASGKEGAGGIAHFTTSDPPSKVLSFYQEALKDAGYDVTMMSSSEASGGIVSAENKSARNTILVTANAGDDGTAVSLTYGSKQ